jgi:hypothetical protein
LTASSERRPTKRNPQPVDPVAEHPRSAGSSVAEAMTETIPTKIAPTERLRMIELGTMNMPNIAITNVVPLKAISRTSRRLTTTVRADGLTSHLRYA